MKKCFVIMPYGGDDEIKQRRFKGVFESIISPAARMAGYEPKRSDIAGEPGSITQDIVRDLANSDIVVADLTDANPNVFYELGVRHAFMKGSTVHIIDQAHQLPFDVRGYRAIEYSTDLGQVSEAVARIAEQIKKRQTQSAHSDNPVHDALPELPRNFMDTGDSALREQLRSLQATNQQLQEANDRLSERLSKIDPEPIEKKSPEVDVDALLDKAYEVMKSTGQYAVLSLRQAMQKGPEAFVKELRAVLKSPYLVENDFLEMVILCKEAGLDGHRRAVMELAWRRFPHSDRLLITFADALDDSPNEDDRNRGRVMLEKRLGIEYTDGTLRYSRTRPFEEFIEAVLLLFNYYNRSGKLDWILSVVESLPGPQAGDPAILRNKARALGKLGRVPEAEEAFLQAVKADPTDDVSISWYGDFLDDQGKYPGAYEQLEESVLADPEDGKNFIQLAIQILNRGYHRSADGQIRGPIDRHARARFAVPLVMKALEGQPSAPLIQEAVRVLVRGGALAEAQAIASGQRPEGSFNTGPLDYLLTRIEQRKARVEGMHAA